MPADAKPIAASARRSPEENDPVRAFALRAVSDKPPQALTTPTFAPAASSLPGATVSLTAALISVQLDAPLVLTTQVGGQDTLPSASFHTPGAQTLEACLRDGVSAQTGLAIGYAEQLHAFADRAAGLGIGYLALTRAASKAPAGTNWRSWFEFLPWEDWHAGRPALLGSVIEPRLRAWAASDHGAADTPHGLSRTDRIRVAFGLDRAPWNEERVIDRYELIGEAGLLDSLDLPSGAMRRDHVRVLASAIGALRTKLKTRPVIFELMEPDFTLFELQKTVEAILGPHLHKQNFRRLVESAGLVEPTGEVRAKTGGRPAKLFRFRQEVVMERPAPGFRVNAQRS